MCLCVELCNVRGRSSWWVHRKGWWKISVGRVHWMRKFSHSVSLAHTHTHIWPSTQFHMFPHLNITIFFILSNYFSEFGETVFKMGQGWRLLAASVSQQCFCEDRCSYNSIKHSPLILLCTTRIYWKWFWLWFIPLAATTNWNRVFSTLLTVENVQLLHVKPRVTFLHAVVWAQYLPQTQVVKLKKSPLA